MPRAGVCAALVTALYACGGAPAASAPVPPAATPRTSPASPGPGLTGRYELPHEVRMVCDGEDGWCEEMVEDSLEIRDAAEGALAITVELVQTNAHTCGFEGTLAPSTSTVPGTRVWRFQRVLAEGDDPEADACALDLAADASSITLTSEGCREYCGVRAQLDARFPRTTR